MYQQYVWGPINPRSLNNRIMKQNKGYVKHYNPVFAYVLSPPPKRAGNMELMNASDMPLWHPKNIDIVKGWLPKSLSLHYHYAPLYVQETNML